MGYWFDDNTRSLKLNSRPTNNSSPASLVTLDENELYQIEHCRCFFSTDYIWFLYYSRLGASGFGI